MKLLFIFTQYFPFDGGLDYTFLEPEIEFIKNYYEKIIIVPANIRGNLRVVPDNVSIDETYYKEMSSVISFFKQLPKCLLSQDFWKEIRKWRVQQWINGAFQKTVWVYTAALITRNWLNKYIVNNQIDLSSTNFYTYWFDHITLGIGLAKLKDTNLKLCSRAHGFDLYEELKPIRAIPFRELNIKIIDRLIFISDHGKQYLMDHYPWAKEKYVVSKLGVKDPGFTTSKSDDGILRIVSCSALRPVKRISLLVQGLNDFAIKNPSQKIIWNHFGGGELYDEVCAETKKLPANLSVNMMGKVSNEEIFHFYKENPVDVFVNVSENEGIPVSIMEAQSCGIPVVATAVGGTPEIVTIENGILLEANPTPEAISTGIWDVYMNGFVNQEKRRNSKNNWACQFDSSKNFEKFLKILNDI